MDRKRLLAVTLFFACLAPQPAFAYLGPGAGLSAIGVILAVLCGILIAVFGFLWYPLKRMRRKRKERAEKAALDAQRAKDEADR